MSGPVDVLAVLDKANCVLSAKGVDLLADRLSLASAAVAELIAEREALAARLAEERAILDGIRDAVGGGPYDTIARRVADLIDKADFALALGFTDTGRRELRAALARCRGEA